MASGQRKLNIMLLAPDLGYGGAERSFAKLTQLLSKRYTVFPVVFNLEVKQAYPIHGELISLDVKSSSSIIGKLFNVIQRTSRLKLLKRELQIDVCISFLEGGDYQNVLSKGKARAILSIRGSKRYDKKISGFSGWIRKRILLPGIYKKADAVIAVSKGLQQELITDYKINPERTGTIYNYYNLTEMEAIAAKAIDENLHKFLKENRCLVTVGRLAPEKGFQQLLQVFSRLKKKETGLKLLFIGENDFVQELKKICSEQGLLWQDDTNTELDRSCQVFFLGFRPEPISIISKSFLFLLPSLTEGFPNALIESMAARVPVVAADCPYGPREILRDNEENGLLLPHFFPYENSANLPLYDQWASAIGNLLADVELREKFIKSARQRVQDFTEEEALKKWSEWIERS